MPSGEAPDRPGAAPVAGSGDAVLPNPIPDSPVAAVLVHVPAGQSARALDCYGQAFPAAHRCRIGEPGFECLRLGEVQIEPVLADDKVTAGAAGTVVYWRVRAFAPALAHLLALGDMLYRGPMRIEDGLSMAQVRDPWSNCIGLRGP